MKKFLITLTLVFVAVVLGACGKKEKTEYYFAAADEFAKGYRYYVIVEKKGDKITDVTWNGYHVDGGKSGCLGDDKYACSEKGNYAMNGTLGKWHEQADAAAEWVVENQKYTDIDFDDEGNADVVTTVSIHTEEMFTLINEALENGKVSKGDYKDGFYYIETEKADPKKYNFARASVAEDGTINYILDASGNKVVEETGEIYAFGTFIVVNGTIVLADFNATQNIYEYIKDTDGKFIKADYTNTAGEAKKANVILMIPDTDNAGQYKPKTTYVTKDAASDWYGMSQIGKTEWDDQIASVEEKLVSDQSLVITVTDGSGVIDGLSSVSIGHSVADVLTILDELEEQAK